MRASSPELRITAGTLAVECFERFPSNGDQAFA
jgi:hypothetical protein